jgi:uncharacterized membrane protein
MLGSPYSQSARMGAIDFFGTSGIDVQKVRSALPVLERAEVSQDQMPSIRDQISQAIATTVGHPPTDIASVCCDAQQNILIYVGLGGNNSARFSLLSAPKGSTCLPRQALTLYDQAMDAVKHAVENGGDVSEDDSHGYALANDATLRAKQVAMHEYAVAQARIIEGALHDCGKPEHRQAAAELLGYATKSEAQISALVRASRDADEEVRNNAIRALGVLAQSNPTTATQIPADGFIEMLNSGRWTDRNKAGLLLMALTGAHPLQLLEQLRAQALSSLIEMAQWRDAGHAYPYRVMLGRIAGFDDARTEQLIQSGGVGEIVAAARNRQ